MSLQILQGDWIEELKNLPDQSCNCCVTSPPYWGLRDYGVPGQLGLEKTPAEYVQKVVEGFREVHRVLRNDGTLWLNLGDCYATGGGRVGMAPGGGKQGEAWRIRGLMTTPNRMPIPGLKPKDLVGIPWRVAFALQADGWYLRSDIIWHKPNPMPESVTDRPTKAHEYIFLLTKQERYFYDAEAIKEKSSDGTHPRGPGNMRPPKGALAYANGSGEHRTKVGLLAYSKKKRKLADVGSGTKNNGSFDDAMSVMPETRNKRTVWTVATSPYKGAHFATFPPNLIKPCILAGCPAGGVVLDPFGGSGTTGKVALELRRRAILIELNPKYVEMIENRCLVTPLLPFA